MIKCPKGTILRKGGSVKSFKRVSGITVRATRRKAICVRDTGEKGKTPESRKVLPKLKKGLLGKYGYKNVKSTPASKRHAALKKGVEAENYSIIVKRLNAVANYNTNTDPEAHKRMKSDLKWMKDNLQGKYGAVKRASMSSGTRSKVSMHWGKKSSKKAYMGSGTRSKAYMVSKKASRKASRKTSSSGLIKAGTYKTRDGRVRQLYRIKGSTSKFYRYKSATSDKILRRYI